MFSRISPSSSFSCWQRYKHVPMQGVFSFRSFQNKHYLTSNLSKSAIRFNVKKFVLVSTDKAVRPTNVMGATKS